MLHRRSNALGKQPSRGPCIKPPLESDHANPLPLTASIRSAFRPSPLGRSQPAAGADGASAASTNMPGRTFCRPSVMTRSPSVNPLVTT